MHHKKKRLRSRLADQSESQCFHETDIELRVHLHPRDIGNIARGVHRHLDYYLLRYVPQVKGIVVAYKKVKLLGDSARVVSGWPLLHVDVKCRLIVFAPVKGTRVVGTVNKIGFDHIGLLLFSLFNATIPADKLKSRYRFTASSDKGESWSCGDEHIRIGSQVRFVVKGIDTADDLLYVIGSLELSDTGLVKTIVTKKRKIVKPTLTSEAKPVQ